MRASEEETGTSEKLQPSMNRHPTNLEPSGFGGLSCAQTYVPRPSRGNRTTEGRMVNLLRRHGLTGWRCHAKLPGRPDLVWPKRRVAVFVDGCFWHGHHCGRNLTPKKNAELWEKKFAATRRRDAESGRICANWMDRDTDLGM